MALNGCGKKFLLPLLSFALAMAAHPARAETLNLLCAFDANQFNGPYDLHVSVDPGRQLVTAGTVVNGLRPYTASVSDSFIRWTQPGDAVHDEVQYTVDRIAGTASARLSLNGNFAGNQQAKCRLATQKF
jgi:hypothetical protein